MTPLPDELRAERKQLRTKLRQKRRNLSPAQQFRAAQRATIRFARHPWYRAAKTLAVYWPNDGELSPLLLMRLALKQGKICCFPSIRADGQLLFKVYFNGAKTHKNRYGIPELNSVAKLCIADLDLMLMPLVGFDSRGNRLGMGGGYYDKTLGSLLGRKRGKTGAQRLKTVGWAHSLQKVEGLHSAKWDIPLRAIATDTELKVTRF